MHKLTLATTALLLATSTVSYAGLLTVGGRIGYGVMSFRENNRQLDFRDQDNGIVNQEFMRGGHGVVGGIYGRIGGFLGRYVYLAGAASYNPQDVTYKYKTNDTSVVHQVEYERSLDAGVLFGFRWLPRSVIFTHLAYSNLRVKSSPDDTKTPGEQPAFTTDKSGGILGFGVDAYLSKHLIATVEYDHGFYTKVYSNFVSGLGNVNQNAYTFSTNNMTLGLAATFA